ncbi:MAG: molybdopterin-dependent oxidoreductase, partial [Proteobacteria bacterium]|nr:molybdopterin-dependent oxidoreductase [Pseudomonadota bacterium]
MPDDSFDQRYTPKELRFVGTTPIKQDGTDKVTGRAVFGADTHLPGMLIGKTLRSPHAHAKIVSIDTTKAEALKGVKAVCTSADFPDIGSGMFADISATCMARSKALFDGHAVAAVAATSEAIAKQALKLIDVTYEVLPHVIDAKEAAAEGAPILHPGRRPKGMEIDHDTNIVERGEWKMGDMEAGFAEADFIVEEEFVTQPMHQGYIEPQACVASYTE